MFLWLRRRALMYLKSHSIITIRFAKSIQNWMIDKIFGYNQTRLFVYFIHFLFILRATLNVTSQITEGFLFIRDNGAVIFYFVESAQSLQNPFYYLCPGIRILQFCGIIIKKVSPVRHSNIDIWIFAILAALVGILSTYPPVSRTTL